MKKSTLSMMVSVILIGSLFSLLGAPMYGVPGSQSSFAEHDFETLSEPPATAWSKTYGGVEVESAWSVVQTGDGGYAMAGTTHSFDVGEGDFWLVKTDSAGNVQWNKTYGGTENDQARCVVQTGDGGYAIAGFTRSFGPLDSDFWLVKTDASGNVQWNKTYGGILNDYARCVVQTSDSGYAIAGETWSYGDLGSSWLVKTDAAGNMQWSKVYDGTEEDSAESVVQTSGGGYAIAGMTKSFGPPYIWANFWLIKTDASGNVQWNKTYGGSDGDYAHSVVQTSDGGYAIAGTTYSYGPSPGVGNFWLVKTSPAGNVQWSKVYGGEYEEWARCVVQTGDGGYAIAGMTESFGAGGADFWLVKTDSAGNVQWNQTYGGGNGDYAESVVQTSDGGYAITGETDSFGTGADFWLIRLVGTTSYTLTITTTAGGTTEPPPDTHTYWSGTIVSVTATPDYGYYFDHWELDGVGAGSDNPIEVTMNADHTLHAVFSLEQYTLTITTTTGGTSSPAPGTYAYSYGTIVTVAATPNTNYKLDHWELDSVNVGAANPICVTMDATHTLHAVFVPIYDVTIQAHCNTEGADIIVSITMDGSPTGYNTPHTFTGLTGTHTFTVPNNDANGHPFKQWSTGGKSTTVTVSSGGTYTAYYEAPPAPVGGVAVSVDKLALLAPYIGLASTLAVATVATAIYIKRVKRRKEKCARGGMA